MNITEEEAKTIDIYICTACKKHGMHAMKELSNLNYFINMGMLKLHQAKYITKLYWTSKPKGRGFDSHRGQADFSACLVWDIHSE